ncbi:MAG: hypothetical protein KKE62_14190 [Proteobacteria bacterium]|nr:hypothetical protein [Pseudomonadota bacterium]MBU1543979.1 hypothetical protein [Pseudomonadota bacterium]MBU2431614.1 hypothetical protein [Pseudomonadota bacterium]MBU2479954.1 hypothetical protein [Pseudomonadota bacterium]
MNRHLIAGQFNPDDRLEIPNSVDEQVTRLDLISGNRYLQYGIGEALTNLNSRGIFPSEIGLDLLILAAHVHAADTRISRTTQSQDSWTREIRLVVPVSDTDRWSAATNTLKKILDFLTGDQWIVGFRQRPERFANIASSRGMLFPPPFNEISLFSGGLDSLIGAINLLQDGRIPLLISHAGEGATSDAQGSLFGKLKQHYSGSLFDRLRVWMAFPKGLVKGVNSENTTRGRSFLFFAIGAFAGSGLGSNFVLRVPENGLIALNVPLDPLRLGSNSTRTTHPFYMSGWNDLLYEIGIDGRVENQYWDKTKGEMVDQCKNGFLLKKLVADSLSCSSPTKGRWKGHGIEHCGYCLPCLIRRAALDAAWGPGSDSTVYTVSDLRAQPLNTNESIGKQVRSFQVAIERLRRKPDLARLLIHKPGPLTNETLKLKQLADVYMRGLNEVAHLIRGVTTRSC